VRRLVAVAVTLLLLVSACGPRIEELDAVRLPDGPRTETPAPTPTESPPSPEPAPSSEPVPSPAPEPSPDPSPSPSPSPPPAPDPSPTTTPASPPLPASLRGAEWVRIPTSERVVALTFDAGANADAVPSILATLEETGATGTFFLTGRWTESFPDLATRVAGRYPLGNHSVSHPSFTGLTDAEVRAEIDGAERTIVAVTGRSTRPLFRFPFGDRDARTIALVNGAGYGSIRWTVDTLGWKGTSGGMTADAVVARVLDTAGAGQIVLMHVGSHPTDGSTLDADALPTVIRELRARGYRFVTLPDALRLAP
jgi:peptidoglycan/xylan/chitin deacetylase (PgdA/CDA1 family)